MTSLHQKQLSQAMLPACLMGEFPAGRAHALYWKSFHCQHFKWHLDKLKNAIIDILLLEFGEFTLKKLVHS